MFVLGSQKEKWRRIGTFLYWRVFAKCQWIPSENKKSAGKDMDKNTPSRKRSASSRNVLGDASNFENVRVRLNNDLTSGNGKKIKKNLQQRLDQHKDAENQAGQPEHEQQAPVIEVSLPVEDNHVLVQKTMENYVIVQQAPCSAKNANKKKDQKSINDYMKRDELRIPTNPSNKMCQRSVKDYIEIQRDEMIKAKTPDSEDYAQISSQVKTSTTASAEINEAQVDVHDSITQPSVLMLSSFQQKNSDSEDAGIDERSIKDEKQTWNSVDVKETFKNESSIYEEFYMPISPEAKEWSTEKKTTSLPQQTASPRRSCFTGAGSFTMQDNLQCLKTEEKDILQLETVIGKGAYGVVRQGFWEGLPVATKSDNDQSNLAEAYLLGNAQKTSSSSSSSSPLWDRDFKSGRNKKVDLQESRSQSERDRNTAVEEKDPLVVKAEDISVKGDAKIGKGGSSEVYKAFLKGHMGPVAVKVTRRWNLKDDLAEVNICRLLMNSNVIRLIGYAKTETSVQLVMNYICGCNLELALGLTKEEAPLTSGKFQILDQRYNGYVLYTAALGLAYLHGKGIIHQDIKPANIMIEAGTNKAIICDMGLAMSVEDAKPREGPNPGTLKYQHQEQIKGFAPTRSVDVYALSVVGLEVSLGERAWGEVPADEVKVKIEKGEYPPIPETRIPGEILGLIKACFREASQRPTVTEMIPVLENMAGRTGGCDHA